MSCDSNWPSSSDTLGSLPGCRICIGRKFVGGLGDTKLLGVGGDLETVSIAPLAASLVSLLVAASHCS